MSQEETTMSRKNHRKPQYPIGTVAFYGPDDKTTTKIAAGVILRDGAEPILKRWVATDVTTSPKVRQERKDFFLRHPCQPLGLSSPHPRSPAHPPRSTLDTTPDGSPDS